MKTETIKDLPGILRKYNTEKDCIEVLFNKRWPDGFRCPRCQHKQSYYHKNRQLYHCKACKFQTSVTAGTIFDKSRIDLSLWFKVIFSVILLNHVSNKTLQNYFQIDGKTLWRMRGKIERNLLKKNAYEIFFGLIP